VTPGRGYRYVGPAELRDQAIVVDTIVADTPAALAGWLAGRERGELVEPFTFVVALDGLLRLGPRPVIAGEAPSACGTAQPERRIFRISIAQTPYPEPTLPVIAPAADPMNRAFAQSGQTSRPVIVSLKGPRTRRRQSGHSRADRPIAISSWPTLCAA
jgi:hypothetical protein